MWLKLVSTLWAAILVLDIAWVVTNTKYGIYRGFVNGPVKNPVAIFGLWAMLSLFMAIVLAALLLKMPRCQAPYWALFFGFTVYFTINATCLCMFPWSFMSAFADIMWGTILYGLVGLIGLALIKKWECRSPAVFHPAAM